MQFAVLASGSAGNASLVRAASFGVLLDLGIGPRALAQRLTQADASWDQVNAALLTHLHTDHWNEATLQEFARRGIPLFCHARHAASLNRQSAAFQTLEQQGLVQLYELHAELTLGPGWRLVPFPLPHDAGMTCGFRLEGPRNVFGECWSLAYAADLGSWDAELVQRLANVDVLALEFNHDEDMQLRSDRPRFLVERALSERGHLSNHTAAALVAEVLRRSEPGRLQHLVQLHLSRQCNEPSLARAAVQQMIVAANIQLHTARQEQSAPPIHLAGERRASVAPVARSPRRRKLCAAFYPWLPGWEA